MRMKDTALLERIARAIHSPTFGNRVDYPLPIDFHTAGRVLAALGLDDIDAAVERAGEALSSFRMTATPDAIEGPWSRRMAAIVLEAALTATSEGGND